jgi:hypothetical protein
MSLAVVWIVIAVLATFSLVLIACERMREFDAHTAAAIDLVLGDKPDAAVIEFKPRDK